MRDFEKTKGMVERWNFLVTCLESPFAKEDEQRQNVEEMFSLSAQFPFAAQRELIDVAELPQMQMWFDVWVRIILKLDNMKEWSRYELPEDILLNAKSHEGWLFRETGKMIRQTASDYNLLLPTLPEQFLSIWDIIEAAQSTKNDNVGNNATHDEKERQQPQISFRTIIQHEDPDKLLQRLHQLIDGKQGADVGSVFLRAKQMGYITRNPTQKEYESEFMLNGSWSAIKNYMSDNNENALDRANKIIIFD